MTAGYTREQYLERLNRFRRPGRPLDYFSFYAGQPADVRAEFE